MDISFKATFVKHAYIKKTAAETPNKFRKKRVSIVELDTTSSSDMKAVNRITNIYSERTYAKNEKYGIKEYNYATDIRSNFNRRYVEMLKDQKNRFFALTLQKNEFETLDAEKILGLVQVNDIPEDDFFVIKYLQADPYNNYSSPQREFRNIGKTILSFITNTFPKKDLFLNPDSNAVGFYKLNGFKETKEQNLYMKRIYKHPTT